MKIKPPLFLRLGTYFFSNRPAADSSRGQWAPPNGRHYTKLRLFFNVKKKIAGRVLQRGVINKKAMAFVAPFSLYIHIPYCALKCPYCDFNVRVVREIPEREYTNAIVRELAYYAESDGWRGRGLKTIFFGGGTPSLFSPGAIGAMIDRAAELFPFTSDVEITLEANPEDRPRFAGFRAAGVNRLSLGAQSFQPHLLSGLGRRHAAEDTRAALDGTRA